MMIGKYRLSGQWRQTWSVNIDADCTLADSLSLLNHSELSICPTSLNARFRIFHRDFSLEKETQYGRNTVHASTMWYGPQLENQNLEIVSKRYR